MDAICKPDEEGLKSNPDFFSLTLMSFSCHVIMKIVRSGLIHDQAVLVVENYDRHGGSKTLWTRGLEVWKSCRS